MCWQSLVVLFLCCFASALGVDPIDFNSTTFTAIAQFNLSNASKNYINSGDDNIALLAPFQYTALSDVLTCNTTGSSNLVANYIIASALGPELEVVIPQTTSFVDTLPTCGPCYGNGLAVQGQKSWTNISAITISGSFACTLSRVYVDALVRNLSALYWINLGPGSHNAYFAVAVPPMPSNLGLAVNITRKIDSLPPPSVLFHTFELATLQKCLNIIPVNNSAAGIIEHYQPPFDNFASMFRVFTTPLPANSIVYLQAVLNNSLANTLNLTHGYSISFSLPILPAPVPPAPRPPPTDAGTAFGIICAVLIAIGGAGIVYYFCVVRKKRGDHGTRGGDEESRPIIA